MRHPTRTLFTAAGLLLALTGCASVTPIGDLLNNPARYDGKTVEIEGQVEQSAGGFGLGAYQVRDNTGVIPVVSQNASPPRTGARSGVVVPSSATSSMRTVPASATTAERSLERKSSWPMVATWVFESFDHAPIEWGWLRAYCFTEAGARRSEFPSRSTGFTALPFTRS